MDQKAMNKLLMFGIERKASDIHFEVGYPPHFRINGDLLGAIKVPPLTDEQTEFIARTILGQRGQDLDFRQPFGEIDVSYSLTDQGRFRASIFRQRGAVGIVLRHIPVEVMDLETLNLPPVIEEIAETRRGMILFTGATGNGKSTTLAGVMRHINETRHAHIITVEDPIEFIFKPKKCMIIQREVGPDTGSFKAAVTAALRQDPDVIMVGEIRDEETAKTCLKASETGHLVLSAIHTPDTVATIQRYVGMFDSDAQDTARERLADTLVAIVSLRLLPLTENRGRVPCVEILRITRTIREAIKANRLTEIHGMIEKGRDLYNMQTFDQHLRDLFQANLISMETAVYASSNPEEFRRSISFA